MSLDSFNEMVAGRVARAESMGQNLVPISPDMYLEWRAKARAQEASGGNRFDPSTPVMETCPYQKSHIVSDLRMFAHLQKCRMKYKEQMAAMGYKGARVTCKYNIRHQVLPPEKTYHEDRCEDRHYIPFYLLYFTPYFEGCGEEFQVNLEECKSFDPVELAKMHEGLFLNTIIGGDNPTLLPVPVDDILHPEAAAERKLLMKKEEEEAKIKQSQVDSGEGAGAIGDWGKKVAGMDEGEEWWNEYKNPKFNYMSSLYNPKRPLCYKGPSGRSKARRREFDKWMTKILVEGRTQNQAEYAADDDDSLELIFYDALYLDEGTGPGVADPTRVEAVMDLTTATTTGISDAVIDADITEGTPEGTVPVAGGRRWRSLPKWVQE